MIIKYHVWAGYQYYPDGGMGDYVGSAPTKDAAVEMARTSGADWVEIWTVDENGELHEEPWSD